MLLRLDDKHVIKTDRYQFMLCNDMGITKFPGGVEAIYFKPIGYYGQMNNIKVTNTEFAELANSEVEMFKSIMAMDFGPKNDVDLEFNDYSIVYDKDCYISSRFEIKNGEKKKNAYRNFNTSLGAAIISSWCHYLRESNKFGHQERDPVFGDFDTISKEIKVTLEFARSLAN